MATGRREPQRRIRPAAVHGPEKGRWSLFRVAGTRSRSLLAPNGHQPIPATARSRLTDRRSDDELSPTSTLLRRALPGIFGVVKQVLQKRNESVGLQSTAVMHRGNVVGLGAATALNAARLSVELRLPLADSVILATARDYGAQLWTEDADFEGIAGVRFRRREPLRADRTLCGHRDPGSPDWPVPKNRRHLRTVGSSRWNEVRRRSGKRVCADPHDAHRRRRDPRATSELVRTDTSPSMVSVPSSNDTVARQHRS